MQQDPRGTLAGEVHGQGQARVEPERLTVKAWRSALQPKLVCSLQAGWGLADPPSGSHHPRFLTPRPGQSRAAGLLVPQPGPQTVPLP